MFQAHGCLLQIGAEPSEIKEGSPLPGRRRHGLRFEPYKENTMSSRAITLGLAALTITLATAACGGGGSDGTALQGPGATTPPPAGTGTAGPIPVDQLPPGPPASGSNTYTCANVRVGAVTLDTVFVPDGATCALQGTRLTGSVQVGARAWLDASGVQVTGNVQSQGAQGVTITGASSIGGAIQLERVAGATLSGARVTGDIQLVDNPGPLVVERNAVGGNLQANQNTGGLRIESNAINGNLECQANLPAPAGGGNTAALKTEQCRVL
jgi:hypothetical protein